MHVGLVEVAGHPVWEAGGYGGQAVLVVPDLDLVVVITQEVGPVFERRLSVLDALEFAVLQRWSRSTLPVVRRTVPDRSSSRSRTMEPRSRCPWKPAACRTGHPTGSASPSPPASISTQSST
jgi:hypothetical protein